MLEKIEIKMTEKDKPFPCIPATIGFSMNQLRYGFVGDPREDATVGQLAAILKDFTEQSKEFGDYTSLIIFYQLPDTMKNTYTVEDYEQLFGNKSVH
nr:YqcI/YcgG family protein [Aquibacillus sediminis]